MRFEILHRRDGEPDTTVVTWEHHFDPLPPGPDEFNAQRLDLDAPGIAVDFEPGDRIIYKYTGQSATLTNAYIANGESREANGRNPAVLLPR